MQFKSGEWVTESGVQPIAPQAQTAVQPEKKMVAVLPFIESEMEQAWSFLNRSHELSGQIQRDIYLLPIKGVTPDHVHEVAILAFRSVGLILDAEGKRSDWQGREKIRDAAGPNSLFRQASWFFYTKKIGPWLWLEPDCWPQTGDWFYDIEREYFNAAKPFYGVKMEVPGGMQYMNGVGVYPWNAVQHSTSLVTETMWQQHPEYEVGFDVAGGKEVLQKAHITRKIQLVSHLARGDVAVRPETVLCHGRIDLSIPSKDLGASAATTAKAAIESISTGGAQKPLNGVRVDKPQGGRASIEDTTGSTPVAPTAFLDRYGAAGDPQTEVFRDASSHAAPGVPSHETPAQESPILDRARAWSYGRLSQDIKETVQFLVKLWDKQPHRKVLIVKELRKAKLVPKHFR